MVQVKCNMNIKPSITLKDGRNIECIRYRGSDDNSIACNWNNPIQPTTPSYYIGHQLNKE